MMKKTLQKLNLGIKFIGFAIVLGIMPFNYAYALSMIDSRTFEGWQYRKEINISGTPKTGDLVKVNLDKDIFDRAKSDLSDLRVAGSSQSEVAYKLLVEKGSFNQENIYPAQILNNSFIPGQFNLFIVDLGQGGYLNSSLRILTSSENFQRQVEISGSDDMSVWNTLKTDGYVYDYTDAAGSFKAQNTNVSYPENSYRYIQVKIFIGEGESLKITGVQVSRIVKSEAKETVFNPKYEVKQNPDKKTTEIIIDLEKKGWPTSSAAITAKGENFNRTIGVYESTDESNWKNIGQSYIFNYNTPKFKGSNLSIDYSESRDRYIKIEIYNGDDAPVSISNISFKTILRNIVFQYRQGEAYTLYYGNDKAKFPEYDLEKIFPYLDTGVYFSAALSAEKNNPVYQKEAAPEKPLTERIPYLLEAVLLVVVVVMGLLVFRFMRKVDKRS